MSKRTGLFILLMIIYSIVFMCVATFINYNYFPDIDSVITGLYSGAIGAGTIVTMVIIYVFKKR